MQSTPDQKPSRPRDHLYSGESASAEMEQMIIFVRLELYNRALPCGPTALRRRLNDHYGFGRLPSERSIARILARNGLTHGRTGWYQGEEWRHPSGACYASGTCDSRAAQAHSETQTERRRRQLR